MLIREAKEEDLKAARAVYDKAFDRIYRICRPKAEYTVQQAERWEEGIRIVACLENRIVGTTQYACHAAHIHVIGLAVSPEYQGRGIARRLIRWIECKAAELDYDTVAIDTICETGNVRLFEHLGYICVETTVSTLFQSDIYDTLHYVQLEKRIVSGSCRD